jgi:hypothetical protein
LILAGQESDVKLPTGAISPSSCFFELSLAFFGHPFDNANGDGGLPPNIEQSGTATSFFQLLAASGAVIGSTLSLREVDRLLRDARRDAYRI